MQPVHIPPQYRRGLQRPQVIARAALFIVVLAACTAAILNAGHGSRVDKNTQAQVVKLPTVIVVGKRAGPSQHTASASVPSQAIVQTTESSH